MEETVEEEKDTVNFSSPPERRFAQRILEFARDMCICCSLWMELLFMKKKEISSNSPKSFKQQGPQSEYRMSQKIALLKFLENL